MSGRARGWSDPQIQRSPGQGVSDVSDFHTEEPCNHGTLMMEGMLEIKASKPCGSQPIKLKPKEVPLRPHGSIVAELGLNSASSIKHTV